LKKKYKDLVDCVQKTFGSKVMFSKDCILLSDDIYDNIQVRISAQTLRRFMNFIDDGVKISNTSLNYLAVYCGYENYKDFIKLNNDNTKIVDSKDIKYIKLFYSINPKNPNLDENYHNASKNIAKLLLRDNDLLNSTSTFLAKNKSAQIFFYERFPFIDGLSSGYSIHLSKYLKEKNNYESQLFGMSLLYFGYAMSNNSKRSDVLKLINSIPEEQIYHPFPLARKFASNILEYYLNQNEFELEKWINLSLKEASNISKWKREYINFPYFQFILADVLNLIERPQEASEVLEICELDYKRLPDFSLDEGYIEALDLIKAINLFQLGKVSESKRIMNRIHSKDIIFIMHDYFQIQRLIIELKMIQTKSSIKYQLKETELNRLVNKTKFYFFLENFLK
jgi:hypothetical protein